VLFFLFFEVCVSMRVITHAPPYSPEKFHLGKRAWDFRLDFWDIIVTLYKWVDQEVVVDGKLVTNRMPDDLPAFMKAVIDLLQ